MAYNFPNSPSNGDTVNVNGIVYTYNSTDNAWKTGTGSGPAILSDGSTPSLASGITAAEVRTLIGSPNLSSVDSDIIPDGDGTRDLGSSSAKFKDLHLSGNTLHLGAQTLQADSSAIILPELKIGSGSNQVTLSGGANGTLQTGGTPVFSGAFSALTGKPTTLAGYGITDGATTSYVTTQINNVIDSAPGALNTLNELAAALNDDANFSTTVTNSLATKAPLASAALTGTPTAPTASTGTNTTQIATTAFVQANKFSGAFSALTGKPTTIAGYGISDAFSGAFSALTGKPTTIAGYGITDAFSGAFSALTGKPTTVSGYGITDALTTGANANIGSNDFITTGKVYFANMFAQTSNLPSATTYHGMFAHVHTTGAAYFAHGGNWIELANKSYVDTQINAVIDSAPGALDTLNELAAALNDDASFSTTVTNSLATKAPLASPSLTGTPTAPTASSGTNNTQIATTAFVQAAVTGGGSYNNASVDSHLNTGTASTNEVLSWNGSDYDWVAQSGGGGGASVTTSDAAPSSPSAGDLWYNTNAGGLFVYYQDANSSQWVEVVGKTGATGPAGGATVSVSDAAPSSPTAGQLWWNSSVNKLYIYYTDANSSQWVQATTPGAAGADGGSITRYANVAGFPGSPTAADLAYANDTNTLYLYNGTSWEVVASGNDESPVITTEPPTTEQLLNSDGTTSTVTMVAQDPEGFAINYGIAYKTANNALPPQLASAPTINQSTGVYTFTPSTTVSDGGTFRARLSASDGARTTTRLVDFALNFTFAVQEMLIVAGGGSGSGGGGGAGGLLYFGSNTTPKTPNGSAPTLTKGTAYTVTVGAGGSGSNTGPNGWGGEHGGNSLISGTGLTTSTYTAIGGGGGAAGAKANGTNFNQGVNGGAGGSGGGGGNNAQVTNGANTGGAGTSGQGNAGGNGSAVAGSPAGGGGGAGGAGGGASTKTGGVGLQYDITGTATYYAGGGGGGSHSSGEGAGGNGGGGRGYTNGTYNASTDDGTANTGGGGGGGSGARSNGGSGIVIIKIPNTVSATGSGFTEATTGSSKVLSFTSSGNVTFS